MIRVSFPPPTPKSADFASSTWFRKKSPYQGNLILRTKGVKVLEITVGAVFAPTRFSFVRISIRDLVADGKSLVRNSGVGGGGGNLILKISPILGTVVSKRNFQKLPGSWTHPFFFVGNLFIGDQDDRTTRSLVGTR